MILYQILMALALPLLVLHAVWTGGAAALRARLGFADFPRAGPRLWIHGASNGELASVRWVVGDLIKARPDLQILVTANSLTGRDLVNGWGMAGVAAMLAPLDTAGAAGRLMDRLQPQALIIVENELWPSRIAAAHRRGVQVLVIGARLSERSAARWARFAGLIRPLLAQIDWLSPQDETSAERFLGLGLARDRLGPTVALKAQTEAIGRVPPFAPPAPRAQCLLAASTHDGEDDPILAAYAAARARGGPRFLIIAPRHPARAEQIAALIAASGLSFAQRSKGQVPDAGTAVFLADTLGEMPHWYAMSGICLIGGTFASTASSGRGGHTPFEPAGFGCAILHGPSVHNFAPQFAALDQGGGAVPMGDVSDLENCLIALTPERQSALAGQASALLAPFALGAEAIPARLLHALPRPSFEA